MTEINYDHIDFKIDNLIQIYEQSFRDNWNLPALTDYTSGATQTYGELAVELAKMHLFLGAIGIKKGDKIALCGKDSTQWVKIFMGALTYGAVIVPILSDFNPQDIAHIVNHSEAVIFFCSRSIWEHLEPEKLFKAKGVMSTDSYEVLYEREELRISRYANIVSRLYASKYPGGLTPQTLRFARRDNAEVAEINYTSGTTGFSKGVMLTGRNLAGNVCFGRYSRLHYKGSRALAFLPLAHAYGCAFDMLTPLAVGSHVTILGKMPSPRILLKALGEVRPNLIICVPLILEKIYKNQILPLLSKGATRRAIAVPLLDSLIYTKIRKKLIAAFGGEFSEVIVGGAPLNHEVEEFLHKIKFPFTVGYGMTECGPLISYTCWKDFRPGTSGRTLPIMESMAMSDNPEKIPGEICVRGVNVMKGYYKNPEATNLVLSSNGWLKTGDIGTISRNGTIAIRGRSKTMLLSGSGQNIYPEEIESKLNNMPFVAESLVVMRDGRLVGLVYPDYEQMDRLGMSPEDLEPAMENNLKELNKIVAPYERLSKIDLMPTEFQKTPKRSIKRYLYSR